MNDWIGELYELVARGDKAVIVSVVTARGSSPRAAGVKMVVGEKGCVGSIGGGQLEHQCIAVAKELLGQDGQPQLRKFVLGTSLDQCCGGVVEVLFEPVTKGVPPWLAELHKIDLYKQNVVIVTSLSEDRPYKSLIHSTVQQPSTGLPDTVLKAATDLIDKGGTAQIVENAFLEVITAPDLNIAVFGAGHVGSALVATISGLDAQIRWVDSRPGIFETTPPKVQIIETEDLLGEVAAMPPFGYYLVMTHSHSLDFVLCQAILMRGDASYCGLIGSLSKRRQFEKRLLASGISQALVGQLICPIGIDGIGGKTPKEIAIAVAAEILQFQDRERFIPG